MICRNCIGGFVLVDQGNRLAPCPVCNPMTAADKIAALEARLEAAEKDAERYRCLRVMDWIDNYIMEFRSIDAGDPKTLDAAIDGYLMKEQSHE